MVVHMSIQYPKVWDEYAKFKADYERSLKHNKTFPQMVTEIMDERGYTIEKLGELSKIDTRTIYRIRSGKIKNKYGKEVDYIPYLKTIIAFCIACDLDMLMTVMSGKSLKPLTLYRVSASF
jgi:predicted transcriptional regulator